MASNSNFIRQTIKILILRGLAFVRVLCIRAQRLVIKSNRHYASICDKLRKRAYINRHCETIYGRSNPVIVTRFTGLLRLKPRNDGLSTKSILSYLNSLRLNLSEFGSILKSNISLLILLVTCLLFPIRALAVPGWLSTSLLGLASLFSKCLVYS